MPSRLHATKLNKRTKVSVTVGSTGASGGAGCAAQHDAERVITPKLAAEIADVLRRLGHADGTRNPHTGEPRVASEPAAFRFIELFAGIGGFRQGLEALGAILAHVLNPSYMRHSTQFWGNCWAGGTCVFASEISEPCCRAYKLNYGSDSAEVSCNLPAIYRCGVVYRSIKPRYMHFHIPNSVLQTHQHSSDRLLVIASYTVISCRLLQRAFLTTTC